MIRPSVQTKSASAIAPISPNLSVDEGNHPQPVQTDLAGTVHKNPTPGQIRQRIRHLVKRYVTDEQLRDRLEDLPQQFAHPSPRPWPRLPWKTVHPSQVLGMEVSTFLAVLSGAINTEAPIRGYTQASRQYLTFNYPDMARFVGGQLDEQGTLVKLGLWEIEERRHTPALVQLYRRLAGAKPAIVPHSPRPYQPSTDPRTALYRHGLHRIATEYSATCLYLWMMAYATGPLQAVLSELLIDEINHMTKFWGYGMWIFPHSSLWKIGHTLWNTMVERRRDRAISGSLLHTVSRMMQVLQWQTWTPSQRCTLAYTTYQVMAQLWHWHPTLTPDYLNGLFGKGCRTALH